MKKTTYIYVECTTEMNSVLQGRKRIDDKDNVNKNDDNDGDKKTHDNTSNENDISTNNDEDKN